MTFTEAVRSVLGQYAVFSGRARRSEYWFFYLFTVLVSIATSIVDGVLRQLAGSDVGVVGAVVSLALLLPSLAVTVRRLHDTGRTGWWVLLPVLPSLVLLAGVLGLVASVFFDSGVALPLVLLSVGGLLTLAAGITMLVFMCLDSQPGTNRYGPSPKPPTFGGGSGPGWHGPGPYPPGTPSASADA